jgi:hypothetical protein
MADQHHAEHVHGSMDIRAQEKTFAGVSSACRSGWPGISIAVLIFMGLVNS